MGLKQWRIEYLPTTGEEFAKTVAEAQAQDAIGVSDELLGAVDHCIRKWEGLSKVELERYEIRRQSYGRLRDALQDSSADLDTVHAGCDSCALCARYDQSCTNCPLNEDKVCKFGWSAFVDGDSRPMLTGLRKLKRKLVRQQTVEKYPARPEGITRHDARVLRDAMIPIAAPGYKNAMGICAHLAFRVGEYDYYKSTSPLYYVEYGSRSRLALHTIFPTWHLYSGILEYPVPMRMPEGSPVRAYTSEPLWADTQYGNDRRDLARYVLAVLKYWSR